MAINFSRKHSHPLSRIMALETAYTGKRILVMHLIMEFVQNISNSLMISSLGINL
jgi:hypothetical protein